MTPKEAEQIISILFETDNGCEMCVTPLIKLFTQKFPQHEDLAFKMFKQEYGKAHINEIWLRVKKHPQ